MKCDNCINSRSVISENGIHRVCCLSEKDAVNCLIGKKDLKITLPSKESKNEVE